MYSNSRSKLLLSLALNKEFRDKVDSYKRKRPSREIKSQDSDYEVGLTKKTRKPLTVPSKRQRISQLDTQDHLNANEIIKSYIHDVILSDILNRVFQELDLKSNSESYKKINIISDLLLTSPHVAVSSVDRISHEQEGEVNTLFELDNEDQNELYANCTATFIRNFLDSIVMKATELVEAKAYTKRGSLRQRKKYDVNLLVRKEQKREKYSKKHYVKGSCVCKKKCSQKITYTRQKHLNTQFWALPTTEEQKLFAMSCVEKLEKKRVTVGSENNSRRTWSFKYTLKNEFGKDVEVCKKFVLATLGYEAENDRLLKNVRHVDPNLITPKRDDRRAQKQTNPTKIDRKEIVAHINSFQPTISHYRREHAPNRLYLPSDISITQMFKNFQQKYPNTNFSYELYRKEVAKLNISFTKLGHEECWECEAFNIHKDTTKHKVEDVEDVDNLECEICERWRKHNSKASFARQEYRKDAECISTDENLIVSADLQKVFYNVQ